MTGDTQIGQTFQRLQAAGRMAFMPFVTAGDPDLALTQRLVCELAKRGADLIEVGFPYSDAIADGPVIESSYTRALARNIKARDIFEAFSRLECDKPIPPLVAMVSYSIVFRLGPTKFVEQAVQAGFSGMIVPDLPGDEALELAEVVRGAGLDLIQLVAPTTPPERISRILQTASGFLYCVSVAGTTGERGQLPKELSERLRLLRELTNLPLAVGFGISSPMHVQALKGRADGVIVGSAIVRKLEMLADGTASEEEVLREIGEFVESMAAAAHQTT